MYALKTFLDDSWFTMEHDSRIIYFLYTVVTTFGTIEYCQSHHHITMHNFYEGGVLGWSISSHELLIEAGILRGTGVSRNHLSGLYLQKYNASFYIHLLSNRSETSSTSDRLIFIAWSLINLLNSCVSNAAASRHSMAYGIFLQLFSKFSHLPTRRNSKFL